MTSLGSNPLTAGPLNVPAPAMCTSACHSSRSEPFSDSSASSLFDYDEGNQTNSSQTDVESDLDMDRSWSCNNASSGLQETPSAIAMTKNLLLSSSASPKRFIPTGNQLSREQLDAGYESGYEFNRPTGPTFEKRRKLFKKRSQGLQNSSKASFRQLQNDDYGLGLGLPSSYSLTGSSLSCSSSPPSLDKLRPEFTVDDSNISPILNLPPPLLQEHGVDHDATPRLEAAQCKQFSDAMSTGLEQPQNHSLAHGGTVNVAQAFYHLAADDISQNQSLSSPAFSVSSRSVDERRPFTPIQPKTPSLAPTLLEGDMSPIDSLPSPLVTVYNPETPKITASNFIDATSSDSFTTQSFHSSPRTLHCTSCRPPKVHGRRKKTWSFGLGVPSVSANITFSSPSRNCPADKTKRNLVSLGISSVSRSISIQQQPQRPRSVPLRPPPSTPSPEIDQRLLPKLQKLPKYGRTPTFIASRLHSIYEGTNSAFRL